MPQHLPLTNLKWMDKLPAEKEIVNCDDDSKGYIPEVALEYPKETHDLHKDFPLAPEVMQVDTSLRSEYQLDLYKQIYSTDK